MLKKTLIGLAALLLSVVGVIATRPSAFTVQRTATLPVTPEIAFSRVNDFHPWNEWSPWARRDVNMKTTYSGAGSGVGAIYAWAGNEQVGEGVMTIRESKPNELILIQLQFLKPWAATYTTTFTFKPVGDGTEVAWSMRGTHDFMGKAFSLFMDTDTLMGRDFENGLANLTVAAVAEKMRRPEEKARAEAEEARAAKERADAAAEAAAVMQGAPIGTKIMPLPTNP
ncbi:SRPBCC family protein [Myxococcaceae bacterium JPH2]|nr:SRPBCC family protein [Myxococcaceae bacterium JPH2]